MDLENSKLQMRKGVLELCVLAVIAERETYPPEIRDKLKDTQLVVVEGTLYPLLTRLKNEGLVDYIWREGVAGPPRKYFTITENGRKFISELSESWHQLVQAVNETLARNESRNGSLDSTEGEDTFFFHQPPNVLHMEKRE